MKQKIITFYNASYLISPSMSIHLKKRSKLYKILDQTSLLDQLFFGFLINDYESLLTLDKIIHHALMGRVRSHIKSLIKKFQNSYHNILRLASPLSNSQMLRICHSAQGQTKIFIKLAFQVEDNIKQDVGYNLSYSHKLDRKNKTQNYIWNSQFYVSNRKDRTLWIYHESEETTAPTYCTDVLPIRNEDKLILNIPFYICGHNVHDFTFYPLEPLPKLNRVCRLEQVHKWRNLLDHDSEEIRPQFLFDQQKKLHIASLQKSVVGNNFRAEIKVIGTGAMKLLEFNLKLMGKNEIIEGVLKKRGCYDEDGSTIMLRQGDTLILYMVRP